MTKAEEIRDERLRIGRRIAQLRQERGLTLRQLDDLCDVGYANICKIEQGRYSTTLDLLAKIARALNARIDLVELRRQRY